VTFTVTGIDIIHGRIQVDGGSKDKTYHYLTLDRPLNKIQQCDPAFQGGLVPVSLI